MATTHGDDNICLWAVDELKLFQTVPCETENRHDVYDIPRISISSNGKFLAWSKQATDVQLWDIERGQAGASIPDSATSIGSPLDFAPDSRSIFVSKPITLSKPPSNDGIFESQRVVVRRWDFLKERELWRSSESERMLCMRASPDGTVLALAGYGDHRAIKLLDAKTGAEAGEFPGHLDQTHEFYFSPDSSKLVSASYDNTLLVWDMKSHKRP